VKIHEIVDTRAAHFGPDVHEIAPDPTGGAYSALPDPLAALRGPTSKGRGWVGRGKGRVGRGREWWGGERKGGKGREGRGQAPQNSGSRTAPAQDGDCIETLN